ncbi:MAG: hypothetical protein NTZ41_03015 [Sphingobacteriales bacterium]|nr:hypothetical protein [Sphingobacteriales bacterium]
MDKQYSPISAIASLYYLFDTIGGLWRKKWLLAHESAAFGNTVQMDLSF